MVYSSKQNPLIKEIASLKDKKHRTALGLYIAEGVKMVNEAIENGLPIKYVVATEATLPSIISSGYEVLTVTDSDVMEYGRLLGKCEGFLSGISSGAALNAAVRLASKEENEGKNIVVLLPDTGSRYFSTELFSE